MALTRRTSTTWIRGAHLSSGEIRIAGLVCDEVLLNRESITYEIDPHSTCIVCLPRLGTRSAVSVSVNVSQKHVNAAALDSTLVNAMQDFLGSHGIYRVG